MKIERFEALGKSYLRAHGLGEWRFQLTRSLVTWGLCDYSSKTIFASAPLAEVNGVAAGKDTLLHEVAHALAGPRVAPHGPKWRRIAQELGADPSPLVEASSFTMPFKYWVTCLACGGEWRYKRRVPQAPCGCGGEELWEPTVYHYSAHPRTARKL